MIDESHYDRVDMHITPDTLKIEHKWSLLYYTAAWTPVEEANKFKNSDNRENYEFTGELRVILDRIINNSKLKIEDFQNARVR